MKPYIFATAVFSLFTYTLAQPHGHRHVHARAEITDYVTVTAPEVIVWINDRGSTVTIETRTNTVAASRSAVFDTPVVATPSTHSVDPIAPTKPRPSSLSAPAPLGTEEPATTPPASTPVQSGLDPAAKVASTTNPVAPTPPPPASPSSTQGKAHQVQSSSFGIAWSPYNADSTCKSQNQVDSDFATLAGAGFALVRVYGVDCNQLAMAIAAAQQYSMVIFAGLINLQDLGANLAAMISQVDSNWYMIDTVNIGNELVNDGLASVGDVVAALGTARTTLSPAGFTGSIVTVDVFDTILANPQLCEASDYCAANCHAFFDDQTTSGQAGSYVSGIMAQISQQIPGKDVMITESGWPWAGNANGAAVPSLADQQAAIGSLRSAFAGNPASLILFDSFDDLWKEPGPYGVEQYFGIYGH